MRVEIEQEADGRWIAEVPEFPAAMAYGTTRKEAIAKVEVLVLRGIAGRLEHQEDVPQVNHVFTVPAA